MCHIFMGPYWRSRLLMSRLWCHVVVSLCVCVLSISRQFYMCWVFFFYPIDARVVVRGCTLA
jgi:hypothetical protein